MKVFISWSGPRAKHVAMELRTWLKRVIQASEPWISTDIEKGDAWFQSIMTELDTTDIGIVCLTEGNLESPWLFFEAGALAKKVNRSKVCTLLVGDLNAADIPWPLAAFQATRAEKEDIVRLVRTVNAALKDNQLDASDLNDAFETYWPRLEKALENLPDEPKAEHQHVRLGKADKVDEILATVRQVSRKLSGGDEVRFSGHTLHSHSYYTYYVEVEGEPEDLNRFYSEGIVAMPHLNSCQDITMDDKKLSFMPTFDRRLSRGQLKIIAAEYKVKIAEARLL